MNNLENLNLNIKKSLENIENFHLKKSYINYGEFIAIFTNNNFKNDSWEITSSQIENFIKAFDSLETSFKISELEYDTEDEKEPLLIIFT